MTTFSVVYWSVDRGPVSLDVDFERFPRRGDFFPFGGRDFVIDRVTDRHVYIRTATRADYIEPEDWGPSDHYLYLNPD